MGDSTDSADSAEVVRRALTQIQELSDPAQIRQGVADAFVLRSNGAEYSLAQFLAMWMERKSLLAEIEFRFEDVCARGDRVAVLRRAKAVTKDGRVQPQLVVIDVWHVHGGKLLRCDQCWQRMQGPAGDDIPFSPQEGERSEVVRVALLGLQNLGAVQLHIGENWAADYRGCVDGLEMDRDALHRHWAALQEILSTVLIDIKELVVSGPATGVVYHLLLGRKDRHVVELRMMAVFEVNATGKITRCQAVVAADQRLARRRRRAGHSDAAAGRHLIRLR